MIILIGCLCYATFTKLHKDKFDSKGIKCVLLGYPPNQKGYKHYNLSTKEVFHSRDALFDEKIFPFSQTFYSSSHNRSGKFPNFGET